MRISRDATVLASGLGAAALALLTAAPAAAASLHTSAATFFAALPGAATTLDFEAFAAGTAVPSGGALADITLHYAIDDGAGGALSLQVTDAWDTTSGSNALGLDDPGNGDQLVAGDAIEFGFATPVFALGLYLVASDPLLPGDVALGGGGGLAPNGVAVATLADGGLVYFVGLVSDTPFGAAALSFDPGATGAFLFAIDDVTHVSVPEPGSLLLVASALGWLARRRSPPRAKHAEDAP